MGRRRREPGVAYALAFGLTACLATSCDIPLSHRCQTSEDCISGECIEGVCRARQANDPRATDASIGDALDAAADLNDASSDRPDATAVGRDATADDPIDGSGDKALSAAVDGATDGFLESADAVSADTDDSGPLSDAADAEPPDGGEGTEVVATCGPAWAEWPIPAPASLTGMPDDPERNLPNPTSYDTSSPDIVVDNVTHLVWQRVISTDVFTYGQAASYCASLDLAGHTGWRLPSRIELISLIDWDRPRQGNIDSVFTDSSPGDVWACTPGPGNPLVAWHVDFSNGQVSLTQKTSALLVRCVWGSRSATSPPARYVAGADGTVTDVKTSLTWRGNPAPTDLTWGDGLQYCQQLGPGWRLPTLVELQTLVDETQATSAVDPSAFPDGPDEYYWTSSLFDSSQALVWWVSIGLGNTYWSVPSDLLGVRCVR